MSDFELPLEGGGPAGPARPAARSPRAAVARKPGVSRQQVLGVAAALVVLCWGAWATRTLLDLRAQELPVAKVQLQSLIGEYVRAQARSPSPPERIEAETARFMQTLDRAMSEAAGEGRVILVNEAIVSGDVADITEQVREAVYARVPRPQVAAANSVDAQMLQYLLANGGENGDRE